MSSIFKKAAKHLSASLKEKSKFIKKPSFKKLGKLVLNQQKRTTDIFSGGHLVAKGLDPLFGKGHKVSAIHDTLNSAVGDTFTFGGASALKSGLGQLASDGDQRLTIAIPSGEFGAQSVGGSQALGAPASNRSGIMLVGVAAAGVFALWYFMRRRR